MLDIRLSRADSVSVTQTLAEFVAGQLRAEMARRQIPKAQLARDLGRDETWVGRRMRGKSAITMEDLEQLAGALDLPVAFFIPAPERVA